MYISQKEVRLSLLLISSFFSFIYILSAPKVSAATSPPLSFTTSPVTINLHILPGSGPQTSTLEVQNNNPSAVPINVQLDTFSANGTNGEAAVTPLSKSDPSYSYVHFSPSSLTAQPGVENQVKMTVNIPKNASLGFYYAVLFKPTISTQASPNSTIIKGSNAILVLIDTNSANEQRQLQVSGFSTSQVLYEYLPVTFNITVHNNGNIYLPPTGDIFISKTTDFSKPIATIAVNTGFGNVLPNSIRIFSEHWSDGFPSFQPKLVDGQPVATHGQPVEVLRWNFAEANKFRFGKYYARLALVYNNGSVDIPITGILSFWVIPWKLLIVFLIILLVVLFGVFSVIRVLYRRVRHVAKAGGSYSKHSRRRH